MVSGDVIQRFRGVLSEPEVRVWRHPPKGATRKEEDASDSYTVIGEPDEPIADRLKEAQKYIEEDPTAEEYALIAYDGFEFFPYEFDQYSSDHDVPDEFKVDAEKLQGSRSERPNAEQYDDPYLKILSPGAFLDVHDGDRKTVMELLMFNKGNLVDLYTAIIEHEKDSPTIEDLADAGVEFSDRAFQE